MTLGSIGGDGLTKCDADMTGTDSACQPACETLGILLVEGFALMAYASIIEPFRAANVLSRKSLYNWINVSVDGNPVRASNGAAILPDAAAGDQINVGTLFVVVGGDPARFSDRKTLNWLRRLAREGVRIAGVSGGPYVLARAGLLDGYRCTVHWDHVPAFLEAFPTHLLEHNLYVIDRKRLTCAGGTAGLDMSIDMIEREHGHQLATQVSEWFIRTQVRPGADAQRMSLRDRYKNNNMRVLRVLAHMEANVEEPQSRDDFTRIAGVSSRQLERLFRRHINASVSDTYRHIRLDHAAALLHKTDMSIIDVAVACGFVSASHFSRAFRVRYGQSPRSVRSAAAPASSGGNARPDA
jgi:AraC family carnitine catabolism transcriptional activator